MRFLLIHDDHFSMSANVNISWRQVIATNGSFLLRYKILHCRNRYNGLKATICPVRKNNL